MAAMNPQLGAALQNPQMRAMLTNPEVMRRMSDPATVQVLELLLFYVDYIFLFYLLLLLR